MSTATLEWTFSDRFRKLRTSLSLRQDDFAALIGQKAGTIGGWEVGGQPRHLTDTARHIERVLDLPGIAAWLLGVGDAPEIPDGWRPRQDSNLRPRDYIPGQLTLLVSHDPTAPDPRPPTAPLHSLAA